MPKKKRVRRYSHYSGSSGRPKNVIVRKVISIDKICRYCMKSPATTVDHIVPRCRGGSNKQVNLVGCCSKCNETKGDLMPKEAGMILHVPVRLMVAPVVKV